MTPTFFQLIYEFLKTGLFAVGGGMATVPFLKEIARNYSWFTENELLDMIAVSESTPGPIGVNMATYAGFRAAGPLGALCSTLSLIAPSIIIILIILKLSNVPVVKHVLTAVAIYGRLQLTRRL